MLKDTLKTLKLIALAVAGKHPGVPSGTGDANASGADVPGSGPSGPVGDDTIHLVAADAELFASAVTGEQRELLARAHPVEVARYAITRSAQAQVEARRTTEQVRELRSMLAPTMVHHHEQAPR